MISCAGGVLTPEKVALSGRAEDVEVGVIPRGHKDMPGRMRVETSTTRRGRSPTGPPRGEAGPVSISSEHPASAEQIYRALVALGAEPILDPESWPEGPREDDRLRLLGALLAKAELEITASTGLVDEGMEDVAETVAGWAEFVGPDSDLSANVLSNRLERTGVQLMGEDEETPPGRAASFMAVVTAADAFGAHLRFRRGDAEGVRRALGRAEASVIGVMQGIHGLRIAIGDAREEPAE